VLRIALHHQRPRIANHPGATRSGFPSQVRPCGMNPNRSPARSRPRWRGRD
jgi:hypothetical protein